MDVEGGRGYSTTFGAEEDMHMRTLRLSQQLCLDDGDSSSHDKAAAMATMTATGAGTLTHTDSKGKSLQSPFSLRTSETIPSSSPSSEPLGRSVVVPGWGGKLICGMDEPTAVATALVAMSALMYSLEAVNVKLMGKDVGYWTISVWRGGVGAVCCLTSYFATPREEGTNPLGQAANRPMLALRGVTGAAAVISSFAALTGTWSHFDTLAAICCTVGVLLVLKPSPLSSTPSLPPSPLPTGASTPILRNTPFGILMALVSAVTTAAFTVLTRYVQHENTSVVSGYVMVACILLAFPGMIYEQLTRENLTLSHGWVSTLIQLFLTGVFSYAALMSKTYAMQITRKIGVIVMRYLSIFFAFGFEAFLLHHEVDGLALLGAAVIVAGCVLSVLTQGAKGGAVDSTVVDDTLSLSGSLAKAQAAAATAATAAATAAAGAAAGRGSRGRKNIVTAQA
ncbi:Hypothetical protein NocV09_00700170 [Nannochloropsis oceanica]